VVVCLKTLEKLKKLMASRGVCIAYGDCNKCDQVCGGSKALPQPAVTPMQPTIKEPQMFPQGPTTGNIVVSPDPSCRFDGRNMSNVTPADLDIASFLSSLPSMGQFVP